MEKLDDEQGRHLGHGHRHEVDVAPVDRDQKVVRRVDDGRDAGAIAGRLALGVEEVVAHRPRDHALPVLLAEDVPRRVDHEQAVDHLGAVKDHKNFLSRI